MYIKGKGKLSYLIRPMVSKGDPRFVVWDSNHVMALKFYAARDKLHMHVPLNSQGNLGVHVSYLI